MRIFYVTILLMTTLVFTKLSFAGGVVRDAETERAFTILNSKLQKIFKFKPKSIKYRLIIDDAFNAMVMGDKNVYYNSGFLLRINNVGQFLSVSAHELSHIKAGHLDKLGQDHKKSSEFGAVGLALAVLGGIASSNRDVAIGAIGLTSQLSERSFFKYVRTQEAAADAMAFKAFRDIGLNPIGHVEIQKKSLEKTGFISANQIYGQTHPATSDRLEKAEEEYENSPYKNKSYPKSWLTMFLRVQAKLFGYTQDRDVVLGKYPISDNSDNARYARAMSAISTHTPEKGLKEMNALLSIYPSDVYYLDSYATLLFKDGQVDEAISIYKKILKKHRKEPLFWMEYGRILVEKGDALSLKEAEYALFRAKNLDNSEVYLYRIMVGLYSKMGLEGKRLLARAEEYYLQGEISAFELAKQAKNKLKVGSAEYQRANDIIELFK